jgi:uncharacterized heparinase superfamily protein
VHPSPPEARALPSNAARTLRTVRHLRPGQIWHRLRYRVRRTRWERSSQAIEDRYRARAADLPPLHWDAPGLGRVAAYRTASRTEAESLVTAGEVLEGRFHFLGRRIDFGPEVDWFRPDLDAGTRLWKTLLHEFGYATDLARASVATGDPRHRERLIQLARHWRRAAPIGCRGFALDAWNARAVATRAMNWAVAGQVLGLRGGDPDADWLGREIGLHGIFLRDNLELDLRGNHLFRDAVGLVFADTLVGGVPDALSLLEEQVAEQVLADGCHQERAPHYHALCTQDLLEVRLLLGDASPDWLCAALGRMAGFLDAIVLGDGEIPLLGDGWLGDVPTPQLLEAVRQLETPIPPEAPERGSGLVPLRAGAWRAVVRAGRHAPDEQMGHAHADLLSFDASREEARIVTDTGTLLYDPGPDRQRIRSTAAHNTLRIDGEEQLEAWGSFRVGRRGRAHAASRGRTGTWDWVSASHTAYRRLPGRPIHHRLVAVGELGILILDAVFGSGRHRIESHLHQHPQSDDEDVEIVALGGTARTEPAPLHEHFGETRTMRRHVLATESDLPWIGGWWITPAASADSNAALHLDGDRIVARITSAQLGLSWKPHCTDVQETFSLCSASGGSAN